MPILRSTLRVVALVAAAHLAACADDVTIKQLDPKMELDPARLEFGNVPVGTSVTREIFIRNTGDATLKLSGVNRGSPFDEAFTFDVNRLQVPASGVATVSVTFSPTDIGARSAKVVIKSGDPKVADQDVELTGNGVATSLEVDPKSLSFGNVVIETTKTLAITLRNTSDLDADIEYIAGINVKLCTSGTTGDAFCLASRDRPIGADSRFSLPAGATTTVEVQFRPTIAGQRERGSFTLKSCNLPVCETEIQLDGIGIEQGFRCAPPLVDFGLVNPSSCATRTVTCENIANEQVTVLGWSVGAQGGSGTPSPDFSLAPAQVQVLEQGDSFSLDATYCPAELGDDRASIQVETDNRDPRLRYAVINMQGSGGGPNIAVFPAQINFGLVSLIAPARRTFTIQNVGYADLSVTDIQSATGGANGFTTPMAGAGVIPVGGSMDVTVEFQPVMEGPITDSIIIASNDQDAPETRVSLTGEGVNLPPCAFDVLPPQVTFGVVERSRQISRSFEIRNTGANDCLVTSVRLLPGSDPEFSLPDGEVQSLVIPAMSSSTFRVEYAPTAVGNDSGTIEFSISDPRRPFNQVPLIGTGADATLLIVPNDIDFGTIGVGCAARARTVTIYNTGSSPATIDTIALGAPANPAFSLSALPALPLTLAPGASTQFDVGFRTDAIASYAGAVEITGTYGGQSVTYVVGLVGRGANDATQVDDFEQLGRPKVDILFVVDTSGSMFEEQQGLATNFSAFIQFADAQRLEYQIAVTTTDVDSGGEQGRFVPVNGTTADKIVTPQTQPTPEAQFLNNVILGTNGSGFEQGLEGAYLALSNPLVFQANAGFLRQDAVLSIIVLSDEEDQSPNSVDFYTNFFLSIKGFRNTNLFTFSAIVGDSPTPCPSAATAGSRYIEVANRTGGVFQSICTQDWSRSLEELSTTAFGFKSRFFLSNQPVVTTIRVFIDGVEIPGTSADGTVNWTYDYGTNSINFSPFATPEPGAQIRAEYTVECL